MADDDDARVKMTEVGKEGRRRRRKKLIKIRSFLGQKMGRGKKKKKEEKRWKVQVFFWWGGGMSAQ